MTKAFEKGSLLFGVKNGSEKLRFGWNLMGFAGVQLTSCFQLLVQQVLQGRQLMEIHMFW